LRVTKYPPLLPPLVLERDVANNGICMGLTPLPNCINPINLAKITGIKFPATRTGLLPLLVERVQVREESGAVLLTVQANPFTVMLTSEAVTFTSALPLRDN
jgi:hypothetical protein